MSEQKEILITNGEQAYAIPMEVCEKYALEGEDLKNAIEAMAADDVSGQLAKFDGTQEGYNRVMSEYWAHCRGANKCRAIPE